jgi:RNA polymerase sigma factor (sigma-70 family)
MPNDNACLLSLIRRVVEDPRVAKCTDQELLRRFRADHDEEAFRGLVRRHGSMVLDVCINALGNWADAEDAFQATFLVLVQKAKAIRKEASVGSWLYGVAYRVAHNARAHSARRQRHEAWRSGQRPTEVSDDRSWREVQEVLYEELHKVAERYRAPLVLCYLEGRTQEEAAQVLGVSKATVKKWLERGRALLRARLVRRGLGPAAVLTFASWPLAAASAKPGPVLVCSTVKAASLFAQGQAATAGLVSAKVIALTKGGMTTMFWTKTNLAVLLVVTGLAAGLQAKRALSESAAAATSAGAPRPAAQAPEERGVALADGRDPLPPGATARLGSEPRLRAQAKAHDDIVMCGVVAPDGKTVVTGGADNGINVLDLSTGNVLSTLKGHTGPVRSVVFFPDGTILASGSEDHTVRLWDMNAFKEIGSLSLDRRVYNLALSPDGKKLATATGDWSRQDGIERPGQVFVWDVATRKQEATLPGHDPTVWSVAFSPDGKLLCSVQGRENVQLWDVTTGKEIGTLQHPRQIRPIAFSPDGRTLATGLEDGDVRLWQIGGKVQTHQDLHAHEAQIFSVRFSPNGKRLVTASQDETVKLWNVSGTEVTQAATLKGHKGQVWFAVFSPDGKTVVTGGEDRTVRIWDVSHAQR